MRVLVTGATGMLGVDVCAAARRLGHEPIAASRAQLDVTDAGAVDAAVRGTGAAGSDAPAAVINCAAYTDVDGAESHPEEAHAVNAAAAGALAQAAAAAGVPFLHVSTDYVFGGEPQRGGEGSPRPYVESDVPDPRGVYALSKAAGEELVLAASDRHLVVRTAWLFGVAGRSFPATMLALARERGCVEVVDDQIGSPTWTGHLAPALIALLESGASGLAHVAGAGEVSWRGLAQELFSQRRLTCEVKPTTTAALGRPAPRPAYSALASERPDAPALPPWQEGVAAYLDSLLR